MNFTVYMLYSNKAVFKNQPAKGVEKLVRDNTGKERGESYFSVFYKINLRSCCIIGKD